MSEATHAAPKTRRPLSRLLVALALLLLGAAAAPRLSLTFEPATLFPELGVALGLPAPSGDGERSRLLAELREAIGRSGEVALQSGEVGAANIDLTVRYRPGVATLDKAILLDSLLGDLRRRLPAGASLQVYPQGRRSGGAAFVIEVPRADPALLDAVGRLPGVAAAYFTGERRPELRIELPAATTADARQLAAALAPRRLGRLPGAGGDRELEIPGVPLEAAPIGNATLAQLGRFASDPGEPSQAARVMGQPAELLVVDRDPAASPLRLERELAATLAAAGLAGGRFLRAESLPLRQLLGRAAFTLAAAALLLAALTLVTFSAEAAAWQLLALPLGLAAALPALYLAGCGLDVLTVPALGLAVLLAPLPAALGRRGSPAWGRLLFAVLAVAALPIALALLGRLGVYLGPAARVFLLAFAAAAASQLLLPAPGPPRPWAAALARRLLARARRRSGGLVLATAVLLYLSWIFFAGNLWPRSGSLRQNLGDLSLALQLPAGLSFAATEQQVERVDRYLAGRPGIEHFFALYGRGQATFYLDLDAGAAKTRARIERTGRRIELQLQGLGLAARAQPLGGAAGAPPLRFDDDGELRAVYEPAARTYRFLLRGRSFDAVVRTADWLRGRLRNGASPWGAVDLLPDWRPPAAALELRARPGADRAILEAAAGRLAAVFREGSAATLPPLPGQNAPLLLRVVPPGRLAPAAGGADPAPALETALAALRSDTGDLGRHFTLAESFTAPELHWQSGLYVLPIDLQVRGSAANWQPAVWDTRLRLRRLELPAGTDLQLPDEDDEPFEKRVQLLGAVALLPLLLLALLAMRLDSLWLGVAALLPGLGALAAAAPLAAAHAGGLDEASLLALAATVAGILPLAALAAGAGRESRRRADDPETPDFLWATRGHRFLCRILPRVAPALLAAALALLLAGAGLDAERHPWVAPQRFAGIALLAGALVALFVSPAVQVGAESLLRSRRPEERARRRALADPPAWRGAGENQLEVRSLSKKYGNGFRALRKVDLRLEPGIVGLLGPNGAGKTTLLRTLCGTLAPSRGQILFRGQAVLPENLREFRRRVGYLPQSFNAWDGLSAERFLDYWADHLELPEGEARRAEVASALASVGLAEKARSAVRELSGGQRRRLGIARALLGKPPILIVDEPTTGLDVEARKDLRESLTSLAAGRIVIFSTHIASDIAAVAKRVLILDRGRLLFDGPPAELIAAAQGRVFERLLADDQLRPFSHRFHITTRIREAQGIRVRAVTRPDQEPAGELVPPNLEEAYLARLGNAARNRYDARPWASLLDLDSWRSR